MSFYSLSLLNDDRKIFLSPDDFRHFTTILEELSGYVDVDILAYCLMPTELEFLVCQNQEGEVSKFIHRLTLEYNEYYFDRYKAEDVVFENDFSIKNLQKTDIAKVSRAIHTNPKCWRDCEFSSIRAYLYDDAPDWLNRSYIRSFFNSSIDYYNYLNRAV